MSDLVINLIDRFLSQQYRRVVSRINDVELGSLGKDEEVILLHEKTCLKNI